MVPHLNPTPSFVAMKRARSSDQSAVGSPNASSGDTNMAIRLPSFLAQSKTEISAKFHDLTLQQVDRMNHGEYDVDASPWAVEDTMDALSRNRYYDIKPWEKSRIRLKVLSEESDYINASPIKLLDTKSGHERKYIACQGPKQNGVDHFWQMVWHETADVAVIVMLTSLYEGQREKCYQYYPTDSASNPIAINLTDEEGAPVAGSLRLVNSRHDEASRSTLRTVSLVGPGQREKTAHHFHFLAWPDHGVPQGADREALSTLFSQTRELSGGWDNPRIVHCSAGVGRSGSFVALEHLMDELQDGQLDDLSDDSSPTSTPTAPQSTHEAGSAAANISATEEKPGKPTYHLPHRVRKDPIFTTVNRLREQRMYMVQSEAQYAFLYDFLTDAYRQRHERFVIPPLSTRPSDTTSSPTVTTIPPPSKPPTITIPPPLHSSAIHPPRNSPLPNPPQSAPATTLTTPGAPLRNAAPAPPVMTPASATAATPPSPLGAAAPASPATTAAPHRQGATGEPSPKVVRLSRGFRTMLADMQVRSVSATRRFRGGAKGLAAPAEGIAAGAETRAGETPTDGGTGDEITALPARVEDEKEIEKEEKEQKEVKNEEEGRRDDAMEQDGGKTT